MHLLLLLIPCDRYDDVRLHHPDGGMHDFITTPNINKLLQQSMEFSNFYTTPMCSTSRAELLTGRWYPRTAAMYINSESSNAGMVRQQARLAWLQDVLEQEPVSAAAGLCHCGVDQQRGFGC